MACRGYKDKLRELAAETLAPGRETRVRVHLAGCAACREALEDEKRLFAAVDVALSEEVNVELSPSLAARIQLAAETEEAPRQLTWWRWAAAGTAVAAAVVLIMVLRGWEVQRAPQAPVHAEAQQAARGSSAVSEATAPREKLPLTGAQGPKRTEIRSVRQEPEVIVVAGEEQGFLKWVADRERWRTRMTVQAVSVALDAPFEIAPLEVKPLTEEQPE